MLSVIIKVQLSKCLTASPWPNHVLAKSLPAFSVHLHLIAVTSGFLYHWHGNCDLISMQFRFYCHFNADPIPFIIADHELHLAICVLAELCIYYHIVYKLFIDMSILK